VAAFLAAWAGAAMLNRRWKRASRVAVANLDMAGRQRYI
jgi:hypothetical protein